MEDMEFMGFSVSPLPVKKERERCNKMTETFGLELSEQQMEQLMVRRSEALKAAGRVELGGGVLEKLVYTFCDSPYLRQADYAETLEELQDLFYYFKTECTEQLTDDELLEAMRLIYNEAARGSLDFLAGIDRDTMCRVAVTGSLRGTSLTDEEDYDEEEE